MYAATTKDEGNAADGRFSTACSYVIHSFLVIWVLMSWIGGKTLSFTMGKFIGGLGSDQVNCLIGARIESTRHDEV